MSKARNWDEPYVEPFKGAAGAGISFAGDKGKTKQADAKDCDLNVIMSRYEKTGLLPQMILDNPQYGDFSEAPQFQEALNIVMKAEEQFLALDAKTRMRFNNSPAEFLAFVTNEDNRDEIIDMGLAKPGTKKKAEIAAEAQAKRIEDDIKAGKPGKPADPATGTRKPE